MLILLFFAKWLFQSFDRTIMRKKGRGRGLVALQFFGYLKRPLELLILFKNVFISNKYT